jgi:hypothetical protein
MIWPVTAATAQNVATTYAPSVPESGMKTGNVNGAETPKKLIPLKEYDYIGFNPVCMGRLFISRRFL